MRFVDYMKKIYIVGSINTDLCISAAYMPRKGETMHGDDFFIAHGGKGANQAVSAARSGALVKMCGCVGDDEFGKSAIEALSKEGIDVKAIKTLKGTSSGTAMIIRCEDDNRIILNSGANNCLNENDIDDFLSDASTGDIFLTQLENNIDAIGYGLKRAKEKEMFVVLNPAPMNTSISPYLKYVDLLTPNEIECDEFGGKEKLKVLVNTLIVTLGSKGFEYIDKTVDVIIPCIKVKPVDTTAAGDTFVGAMLARFAEGIDLIESAKYGSMAASIACTRKGAQPSIPTSKEIEKFTKSKQ